MILAGKNYPHAEPPKTALARIGRTSHLLALHDLGDDGRLAFTNLVGAWFVNHDEMSAERLTLLIDEARAVSS